PVVSAGRPASKSKAGSKCQSGRDETAWDISRRPKIIWWIRWRRPPTVDNGGIVIRHIHRVGARRLDDDGFFSLLLSLADRLLLGRCQFFGGVSPPPQTLDRVHDIRLLGKNGVTELERPVQFRTHC